MYDQTLNEATSICWYFSMLNLHAWKDDCVPPYRSCLVCSPASNTRLELGHWLMTAHVIYLSRCVPSMAMHFQLFS